MTEAPHDPELLLRESLESGRIHSAYLISGPEDGPRLAALRFARALACTGGPPHPCESCSACRRSAAPNDVALDGAGSTGPLYRNVGEHPDLIWVERGASDTRVRIGQIRAVQRALRLRSSEGGRRAAVIADAEWLNQESQNALLRLLEEPPPQTTLILVTASPAGLLATVRSRCQRVAFPPAPRVPPGSPDAPEDVRELAARLDGLAAAGLPDLLDWAEEYRGARAVAADGVARLLETGSAWLRERVARGARQGEREGLRAPLEAFRTLSQCRKALAQRNANAQMVAERALLALHEAATQ